MEGMVLLRMTNTSNIRGAWTLGFFGGFGLQAFGDNQCLVSKANIKMIFCDCLYEGIVDESTSYNCTPPFLQRRQVLSERS